MAWQIKIVQADFSYLSLTAVASYSTGFVKLAGDTYIRM